MKKFEEYKSEEILPLRIKNKIDTIDNWKKNGSTFTPLDGEIIIATETVGDTKRQHLIIGDGKTDAKTLVDNLITDAYIRSLFEEKTI